MPPRTKSPRPVSPAVRAAMRALERYERPHPDAPTPLTQGCVGRIEDLDLSHLRATSLPRQAFRVRRPASTSPEET